MAGQKLTTQQKASLKLTPKQMVAIRVLSIPSVDLDRAVEQEVEKNPLLERQDSNFESSSPDPNSKYDEEIFGVDQESKVGSEGFSEPVMGDYFGNNDYFPKQSNSDTSEEDIAFPGRNVSSQISFHEYLMAQIGQLELKTPEEHEIAEAIVGNIGPNGLFESTLQDVADDFLINDQKIVALDEIARIHFLIKSLDPPGVGASSRQESYLIQIDRKLSEIDTSNQHYPILLNAHHLVSRYWEPFKNKKFSDIERLMRISKTDLRAIIEELGKLNFNPGNSYEEGSSTGQVIVPDYEVINNLDGSFEVKLNRLNAPSLTVNKTYSDLIQNSEKAKKRQKEQIAFLKQQLDDAKFFILAIQQRQQTMLQTMRTIVEIQTEFFETGDRTKLKPMILQDIADQTGLDKSTISRVTKDRFVVTEYGMLSLRSFFSEGMNTTSPDGDQVSTAAIKEILLGIIEKEDKKKPLSDAKIESLLKDKYGMDVARRTVTKYRSQFNIPAAYLRKELI